MLEAIISGIIGGCFTLIGIWLDHHLRDRKKNRTASLGKEEQPNHRQPRPSIVTNPWYPKQFVPLREIASGVFLLFIGGSLWLFIFNLNKGGGSLGIIPFFLWFIGGVIAIYGIVRIISGIYRIVQRS